jgi:hypothetical protein
MKSSEADLCQEFRVFLESRGFVVYPEVSTWDLVAKRDTTVTSDLKVKDWKHGEFFDNNWQLGFQAKLFANVDVLHQSICDATRGPELRFILVPRASSEFIEVARKLGVGVVVRDVITKCWGRKKTSRSPDGFRFYTNGVVWGSKPLELPSISTDLVAGGRSPKQLTKWRERALGICRLARTRGWVTSEDFKTSSIDMGRWIQAGWLVCTGSKTSSKGRPIKIYALAPTNPEIGWEKISEQLHNHISKPVTKEPNAPTES